MNMQRREVLKLGATLSLMVGAGLMTWEEAFAQQASWNKAAFESKTLGEAEKALGASSLAQSKDIVMNAPDIAENGAVVPIAVVSKIPNTQSIYLLVEKNPNPLAGGFNFPAGTEPAISTRIKMAESSGVHAVVKADDKFYYTVRDVKVTLGGCGG